MDGSGCIPAPITVAEYERLPAPPEGWYELHHGELHLVTRPVRRHWDLQRRLRDLLRPECERRGYLVDIEYGCRPLPENEVWGADVAAVRLDRHESVDKWLLGSPELVIEVKSPSNTKAELHDKAMTTLAGDGAVEFWIVDAETETVTVHSKLAGTRVYIGRDALCPSITGLAVCCPADLF
jgi:Uma2 family endonuclease